MNIYMLVLVLLVGVFGEAHAATYYVATNGNNGNSCSAAQSASTPKLTLSDGVGCLVGGDTLIIKAGTYTGQQITNPPAGTDSAYTVIQGDPGGARPVILPDYSAVQRGFYCSNGAACHHIEMRHLEVRDAYNVVKLHGNDTVGYAHHINIIDNYFYGGGIGILIASSVTGYVGGDHLFQGNTFEQIGRLIPNYRPGVNTIYNPGNRSIVEHNTFRDVTHGVGIWREGGHVIRDVIVRNNIFHRVGLTLTNTWSSGATGYTAVHVSVGGGGHRIYNNVIYNSCDVSICRGIVSKGGSGTMLFPLYIHNNTVYDLKHANSRAIIIESRLDQGPYYIRNNIAYLTGGIVNGTQSNNLTTNPSFTNAGTYDLTLAAGSAAINAGTAATGASFCGSAPDIGAYETLAVTAASINGNTMDVTICTAKPPVMPGTFTVGCTGTGCGTPTVSSAATTGGGLVRLTIGGITGGVCAAGQTWTVSAGTTTTDSALVGGNLNQPLHTVTNFAVNSSACTGTPPDPPPSAPAAEYNFENNLNDDSGNANHAIGSANITYAASRDGLGVQFVNGVDSYVDTGLLNGHNPSTTHLVVAFGIHISASELGKRRFIAGVALGTNQRFYLRRDSTNVWNMFTQTATSSVTEFPVVSGNTHCCAKLNPTTNTATLYINGVAGTVSGASLQSYTSYTFPSTFRFGLPSGLLATQASPDLIDQAFIYTTDVSCVDLYNAWNPVVAAAATVQAAHRWQGVRLTVNDLPEDLGSISAVRKVVKGGAIALITQINCTGGNCGTLQPRFRYNVNGGTFNQVVPDQPTADGVSMWGEAISTDLNRDVTGGALSGALTHTNGITLTTSTAIPTVVMNQDTSYTLRGIFRIDANVGDVVCIKVYDQSGSALAGYTPSSGACSTVIAPQSGQ